MRPFFRLSQVKPGPAGNHIHPVFHEVLDKLLEIERFRAAPYERQIYYAEGRLERGPGEQLVEHNLGECAALEFDNNAYAVAVGFIPYF